MKIQLRDERGIAVVTALLLSTVLVALSLTVVSLSLHNTNASSYDRKRVQAIDAAEAGLNATFQTIAVSPTASLPCAVEADLPTTPTAHYLVEVDYYATYPISGDPLACPPPSEPAAPPQGARLVSTGTAVTTGSAVAVSRTMEAAVRLGAVYKPYGQAIFANTNLNMQNNLDVYGDVGNDGDVYTNGDWVCNNSSYIRGSVITQGSTTMGNSCTVAQDVYAKTTVSMSMSATVSHDVTAANSSITMSNNTHVYNNATSGTTCTGCTTGPGGRVAGTVTTSHISPPPPVRPFPVVNFDQAAWQDAGYTVQSYSNCTTAKNFITDTGLPATKFVVRVTSTCGLQWGNQSVINIREDLAIITDGSITTQQQTTWKSADGASHILYMIVPYSAGPSCSPGVHDISLSSNTSFTDVKILLYSPCTVTMSNNNAGQGGQIFGGVVNIQNLYSLQFQPILIPGAGDVSGYTLDIAYLREVVNPA